MAASGLLHEKYAQHLPFERKGAYHFSSTGHPLQKAHPKSAVCCSCTVRSTLCICLLLIYFLSLAFVSTPGTCRPCNLLPLQQLLPIQMVVGVIELWFLYVVTSIQWPLAHRASHQLLVSICSMVQTQLCTFLIINHQSDKGFIAESRQQPIQASNTLWILCQHNNLLFAEFCLKIPMLFLALIYLLTCISLVGFNKAMKLHVFTFFTNPELLHIQYIYNIILGILPRLTKVFSKYAVKENRIKFHRECQSISSGKHPMNHFIIKNTIIKVDYQLRDKGIYISLYFQHPVGFFIVS